MMEADGSSFRRNCCAAFFLVLAAASVTGFASAVTVSPGVTFNLTGQDITVELGQEVTESQIRVFENTLQLSTHNLSFDLDEDDPVRVVLWMHDNATSVTNRSTFTVFTFAVHPPDPLDGEITVSGLPNPENGTYRVTRGNTHIKNGSTGGNLSFFIDFDNDEAANFTLAYNTTTPPLFPNRRSQTRSFTNLTEDGSVVFNITQTGLGFTYINFAPATDIPRARLSVVAPNQSTPVYTPEDNNTRVYRSMQVHAVNLSNMATVRYRFPVNQSWLRNHSINRSTVTLHRFHNQSWTALSTRLHRNTTNPVYEASSPGFSPYTVTARTTQHETNETSEPAAENQTGDTTNDTAAGEPVCGDNTCNGEETWQSCSSDCPKPDAVSGADNAIQTAEANITTVDDPGYQTLQQAREAYRNGNYTGATQLAETALAEYQAAQTGGGFPWLLTGLLAVITVALALGYWQRHHLKQFYTRVLDGNREEYMQRLDQVSNQVLAAVERGDVNRPRQAVMQRIVAAEHAIKQGNYDEADQLLRELQGLARPSF